MVRTASLGLNLPSPASLARLGSVGGIVELGAVTALALRYLGVNLNFAPVLDICHDPSAANALPGRCWGDNAQDVISRGGVYASNLRRGGVQSCGKHFPGMGRALADPHFSLPVIGLDERELFKTDLLPFLALCPALSSIMSAHIMLPQIDPDYPATLSERVIRGLLRDRLGFRGVVFTDDLCMGAITTQYSPDDAAFLSLKAGCDLPLICHDPLPWLDGLASRLESLNAYDREDSFKRVEKLSDSLCFPFPEKGFPVGFLPPPCGGSMPPGRGRRRKTAFIPSPEILRQMPMTVLPENMPGMSRKISSRGREEQKEKVCGQSASFAASRQQGRPKQTQ